MSVGDYPLIEELSPAPGVAATLHTFADWPGVILLDSALQREGVGRYSFLAADPFHVETLKDLSDFQSEISNLKIESSKLKSEISDFKCTDPLHSLREMLARFPTDPDPELPPFQGGAAGLLSYDLGRAWERIPPPRCDEFRLPVMAVGLYDWVIAWDHLVDKAWVISQGFPETDPAARRARAACRMQTVRDALAAEKPPRSHRRSSPIVLTAPQWPAPGLSGLTSNFSRDDYLRAVERAIEYIHAGDLFQVNLSQRLLYPLGESPLELYLRLRECNPAPFAGYFAHDDWVIASASPERFVAVANGEVETRPIKGTRRRRPLPEADLFTRDELRESAKDQAENVMIVDLLRNDLSRVCRPGTIRVPQLCRVESYETVQHLVSEIRGRLQPGKSAWDLFAAAFPGGSITGAPKVRAMEIIAELEPTARGPYCGSLFYVGFDGRADSNILIRTFTIRNGWVQCPVGGGIVAQSDPAAEYEETLHKADGMLRALRYVDTQK
ncbi:MAG: aminodeoxychorismate synthase component I [Planctomycetaceae bacterium]|nr:aminodeoxychorismate synthase component I [Planctomycetaceae bacterium]